MGSPVVHFEIMGKDAEALQGFYSELFGWEIDANNPMNYGVIPRDGNTTADGIGIGGGIGSPPEGGPSYVTVYVGVDDAAAELKRANDLGATTLMEPADVMEGVRIALFSDPEGHVIGLFENVQE
jgi:predicted enzyme related to lactoylglutathione lyase